MSEVKQFYIGWDVGAWSCNAKKNSCDAIVILDSEKNIVGMPWRDSLNKIIFESETVEDFLREIFKICGRENLYSNEIEVVIGIDAVLGFSKSFKNLINKSTAFKGEDLQEHKTNPYIFRQTELFLFKRKHSPLSALTHMIGSQATKAMHVLAKFDAKPEKGIWKSQLGKVKFIETYPATCGEAYDKECEVQFGKPEEKSIGQKSKLGYIRNDIADAYKCARVAHVYCQNPHSLYKPKDAGIKIPRSEGWIWALKIQPGPTRY